MNNNQQLFNQSKGVMMADTIKLKIKDLEPPKFKCATCDNNITELRVRQFPICDDCLKALREIIKVHKENGKSDND